MGGRGGASGLALSAKQERKLEDVALGCEEFLEDCKKTSEKYRKKS